MMRSVFFIELLAETHQNFQEMLSYLRNHCHFLSNKLIIIIVIQSVHYFLIELEFFLVVHFCTGDTAKVYTYNCILQI